MRLEVRAHGVPRATLAFTRSPPSTRWPRPQEQNFQPTPLLLGAAAARLHRGQLFTEHAMTNARTQRSFTCLTSGQMLGALVSAFRLHQSSVGGPSAEFIGSGNAGKRARDYFEGKWIPEETRHEICTLVVQALVHSRILPPLRLPAASSGEALETEQVLRIALFTWLQIWDAAFVAPAARWPSADAALSGFVMGRQVVIDLALRWAAFCHLAGFDDPDTITVEDANGSDCGERGGSEPRLKRPLTAL